MVDDSLKRLLDAEAKAELIIAHAEEQRNQLVAQAKQDIQAAEQRHAEHLKEIQASALSQADQRAQQTIAELKRRHAEQVAALRSAAVSHEAQALDTAVALLVATAGGSS